MSGYMYILECANGEYYTGSTVKISGRTFKHSIGKGANFTQKHLPVKLVYYEFFQRIEDAFKREKQVQKWSYKKKEALINRNKQLLHELSECKNESHFKNNPLQNTTT